MTTHATDINLRENRGPKLVAVLWTSTVVAVVCVVARITVRFRVLRYRGVDDYLIITSLVIGLAGVVLDTIAVHHGLGHHAAALTFPQIVQASKYDLLAIPFNLFSSALAKCSVCFFLIHVGASKLADRVLFAAAMLLLVFTTAASTLLFAQCSPVEALWDPRLRVTGRCLDPRINGAVGLALAVFFVAVDLALAAFPMTFLWTLQMNRRTKVALMVVLSLGVIAAAFGIVRCVDLQEIDSREDILFSTIDLSVWSCLEQNITIIAACIPPLYSIFRWALRGETTHRQMPRGYVYASHDDMPSTRRLRNTGERSTLQLSNISRNGRDRKMASQVGTKTCPDDDEEVLNPKSRNAEAYTRSTSLGRSSDTVVGHHYPEEADGVVVVST